ncbi:MAG: hypothetical protein ACREBG_24815 [Pyrinomonadaceae bacterium]
MSRARTLTGQQGAEAVIVQLTNRGHVVKGMPNHNKGFDVDCQSPNGCQFRVEVKTSSSKNTHIPIQLHHVEGPLKPDLFFVLVNKLEVAPFFEYYILTHEELKAAWIPMPKQMMNEKPYVIDRAHIDWRLIELQRERWYKLPK